MLNSLCQSKCHANTAKINMFCKQKSLWLGLQFAHGNMSYSSNEPRAALSARFLKNMNSSSSQHVLSKQGCTYPGTETLPRGAGRSWRHVGEFSWCRGAWFLADCLEWMSCLSVLLSVMVNRRVSWWKRRLQGLMSVTTVYWTLPSLLTTTGGGGISSVSPRLSLDPVRGDWNSTGVPVRRRFILDLSSSTAARRVSVIGGDAWSKGCEEVPF